MELKCVSIEKDGNNMPELRIYIDNGNEHIAFSLDAVDMYIGLEKALNNPLLGDVIVTLFLSPDLKETADYLKSIGKSPYANDKEGG